MTTSGESGAPLHDIGSDYFHACQTGQRWFECDVSILEVMTRVSLASRFTACVL